MSGSTEPAFVRMDGKLRHRLRHQAFAQNMTQYDLLNRIVAEWLSAQPEILATTGNS